MIKILSAINSTAKTLAVTAEAGEIYMQMQCDALASRAERQAERNDEVAKLSADTVLHAALQANALQRLATLQAEAALAAYQANPIVPATVETSTGGSDTNAPIEDNDYTDVVFNDDGAVS